MADETKTAVDAAADAAKSGTEAAGEAAKQASATAVNISKQQAKAARSTAKAARTAKPRRTKTKAAGKRKAAASKATRAQRPASSERINDVNNDFSNGFAGFGAIPAAAPFQALFAGAGERSQEAVRRSQKAVEELADLNRANVEALVDAGKIAVEGARSIGQDVVESSREGVEQAADAVRALAEAKSPTEFIQLQSEFARASFDRFVSESSRLTESVVKLAGEAFQPISTRASLNAERINKIVA